MREEGFWTCPKCHRTYRGPVALIEEVEQLCEYCLDSRAHENGLQKLQKIMEGEEL